VSVASKKQKVFGIGLNKTGTTTLGQCLVHLGYRHLSCRKDLLQKYRQGDIQAIKTELDNYDSFEDWPYPLMYRELFEFYPDARFILTTRLDAAAWLRSLMAHSLRSSPKEQCRSLAYGYEYPHGFEAEHLAIYDRHNAAVGTFFQHAGGENRLLKVCWERGDRWEQLCGFLGEPVPSTPFPRANAGAEQMATAGRVMDNRVRSFLHRVFRRSREPLYQ
jgi:hypothetical protein